MNLLINGKSIIVKDVGGCVLYEEYLGVDSYFGEHTDGISLFWLVE